MDEVGIEKQWVYVSFSQVVNIDQTSQDLQTQSKTFVSVDILTSGLIELLKQLENDLIVIILDEKLSLYIFLDLPVLSSLTSVQHILNQDQFVV